MIPLSERERWKSERRWLGAELYMIPKEQRMASKGARESMSSSCFVKSVVKWTPKGEIRLWAIESIPGEESDEIIRRRNGWRWERIVWEGSPDPVAKSRM